MAFAVRSPIRRFSISAKPANMVRNIRPTAVAVAIVPAVIDQMQTHPARSTLALSRDNRRAECTVEGHHHHVLGLRSHQDLSSAAPPGLAPAGARRKPSSRMVSMIDNPATAQYACTRASWAARDTSLTCSSVETRQ